MGGSKWANFAEYNFADEQFSVKNFAHFDLISRPFSLFFSKRKKIKFHEI